MPPVRTFPPAKPVKTERTHAENQERAYIAASRRSDRSLEARVESARRASEIHKKRTGRSLRVTEADVINEEMYEEEDDDLPAQIRRITAHLHTGNDPFNRRLQAYLANHIAMRSALGQVVADNWQQQQMQNNTINQYLTPALMQQQQNNQQQFALQNSMRPPQSTMPHSPQSFRTSPYPVFNGTPVAGQTSRPGNHVRSASIAAPCELSGPQVPSPQLHSMSAHSSPVDTKHFDRRFSLPPQHGMPQTPASTAGDQQSIKQESPNLSRTTSAVSLANQQPHQLPTPPTNNRPGPLNLSDPMFSSPFGNFQNTNFGPLTATLPLEAQQLLAGAPMSEFNDPSMAAMMQGHVVPTPGGSFTPAPGFYSYNPNGSKPKNKNVAASAPPASTNMGMNATLAPSMLDLSMPTSYPQDNESIFTPYTPAGFGFGFDGMQGEPMASESNNVSGQVTPAEGDWKMWLDSQALTDEPAMV